MWISHVENNKYIFDLYYTNKYGGQVKKNLKQVFTIDSNLDSEIVCSAIEEVEKQQKYISIKSEFNKVWPFREDGSKNFCNSNFEEIANKDLEKHIPNEVLVYGATSNYLCFTNRLSKKDKKKWALQFLQDVKAEIIAQNKYKHLIYLINEDRYKLKSLHKLIDYNNRFNIMWDCDISWVAQQEVLISKKTKNKLFLEVFQKFQGLYCYMRNVCDNAYEAYLKQNNFTIVTHEDFLTLLFNADLCINISLVDFDNTTQQKYFIFYYSAKFYGKTANCEGLYGFNEETGLNYFFLTKNSIEHYLGI